MTRLTLILVLFFLASICSAQTDKYDFDATKYKFDTPDELVKSYIKILKDCDPDKILEHCISKEAALYFIEQTAKLRPDAQNIDQAIQATEAQYKNSQQQYVIATKNIKWHIDKDSVDITKIEIVSIDYAIEDWYGLNPKVMFASVIVKLKYKDKEYTLKLPQLGRLKDKWFILGPEFWWGNKMMSWERPSEEEVDKEKLKKQENKND